MNLTSATTQDERKRLVDKVLLQRLLMESPLNLPRVFVYALYFTFMPGGIIGPVPGMVSTVIMAAIAAWLWLWGAPRSLDTFLWFWLIWVLVDLLLVLVFRLVMGIWEFRCGRRYLPAEDAAGEPDLRTGDQLMLDFAKGENGKPGVVVQVPEQGVYVLTLKVVSEDSSVDLRFSGATCLEEQEMVPGLVHICRAAYRLSPGRHTLAFHVQSRTASRLSVSFR